MPEMSGDSHGAVPLFFAAGREFQLGIEGDEMLSFKIIVIYYFTIHLATLQRHDTDAAA
jgi:hypothetical protein